MPDLVNMPMPSTYRDVLTRIEEETERWCWKALAQGVGNRVWRSELQPMEWPSYGYRCNFAILKPGEYPPDSGVVIGPFSGIA